MVLAMNVLSMLLAVVASTAVEVAPGGSELQACVTSGAARCHLLPGVHREHADEVRIRLDERPLILSGAPGSVLSGAKPVPGPWTNHKGNIFKTQLPSSLRNKEVQQAWAKQTWLPEARWPNANLTHGPGLPGAVKRPQRFP
jgi:hypothetical protein